MRAIAIGGVLLLHLDRAHFPGGAFGVDVFFVLSSYLITSLLLDEVGRHGRIRFGAFYWRRFFRLYPALLLWLVALAIPTAFVVHQSGTVPWSAAGAVFYFNDFLEAFTNHVGAPFDQSWSLAVEEQFYFVWPMALALIATRFGLRGQRAIVLGLVVVSVVVWVPFGNYFLPTGHLVPLALGCWAAYWLAHGGAHHRPRRSCGTAGWLWSPWPCSRWLSSTHRPDGAARPWPWPWTWPPPGSCCTPSWRRDRGRRGCCPHRSSGGSGCAPTGSTCTA
jgi:peptidoglycan/LPS O-acetylase OafA/YrhL